MLKNFLSLLKDSVKDKNGKISSSRISSYFILFSIVLSGLSFIVIEIINASIKWKAGNIYIIPTEHIALFGMILGHHLVLLGIVKNSKSEPGYIKTNSDLDTSSKKTSSVKIEENNEDPII